jgi:hypothetical protein
MTEATMRYVSEEFKLGMLLLFLLFALCLVSCAKPSDPTPVAGPKVVSSIPIECCKTEACEKFHLLDENDEPTHACWSPHDDPNKCFICERIGG